jgi:hypothetical protein
MSTHELDRRAFLKRAGALAALGLGAQALAGCGAKEQEPCSDISALSAPDRQTRITYGYRGQTLIEAKRCDNCNFWKAAAGSGPCGSCTLVKGPIAAAGYCNSWAAPLPPGQAAPSGAPAPVETS